MKNTYFRNADEVSGSTTAFTEITINASPEVVRTRFLEFDKWGEWNTVIPKIVVNKGDIHNLETKPNLALTLDFGRKGDPAPAPVNPKVFENTPEVFNWGFNIGLLKAEHVFIFKSIDKGKATHLVHYEKMSGILKTLVMKQEMKKNMVEKYNLMNKAFKRVCEAF